MEEELTQAGSKGLVIQRFEVEDVLQIHQAVRAYRRIRHELEGDEETLKNQLISRLKGAGEIKRGRSLRNLGKMREYHYVGPTASSLHEQMRSILEELFPRELAQTLLTLQGNLYSSRAPGSAISKTHASLQGIESETNTFLKYFFLTPINHAAWEKHVKETIPVTESWWALFAGGTSVRPFEKAYHERGSSMAEDMQMLRAPLLDEHVHFLTQRIRDAALQFRDNLRTCTTHFKNSYPEPERANDLGEAFAMDVGIMNHSLEGIMEAPVPMKGACAMLFNTAFQRVRPEVQEALESLSSIARALLELRAGERHSHSINSLYA